MRIHQFLEHYGITRNPFAEEDAQTDPVFKGGCISSIYHPAWDKVYGDPSEPSTAIVFGEKGAGKTAMRLQIARELAEYNRAYPDQQSYVIHYDDFNPFLDRFREHLSRRRRRPDRVLNEWKLWDHMDAILSLGVTGLVDRAVQVKQPSEFVDAVIDQRKLDALDRHQARDLLLLAACYDQSMAETYAGRWARLRQRLRFRTWRAHWDLAFACLWTLAILTLVVTLFVQDYADWLRPLWLYLLIAAAGWIPWLWRLWDRFRRARGVVRRMRVGNHQINPLRRALMHFTTAELSGQPLPNKDRTDDRYELLLKFQGLLRSLGFRGILVLVDRVDEPYLINGSAELMKGLIWPMLDNKFLKHPGLGVKLMLPIELTRFLHREDREFYERSRLDKQNMVQSFEWSGEALYDVANARLKACASEGATPSLRDLFSPSLSDQRLIEALRQLRVPRHLFKFFYRLLVEHCNAYTDQAPEWKISAETFESTLAVYLRDQDAFERGLAAG